MTKLSNTEEDLLKLLIAKRYELPSDAVQLDMLDFFEIVAVGAKKYAMNNWLETDGKRCSHKEMHESMFHHLADSYAGKRTDIDSRKDPLLHLITRGSMYYTRLKLGIIHPNDDKVSEDLHEFLTKIDSSIPESKL